MKIPTVVVPVNLVLTLARAYFEQPQECLNPTEFREVKLLEQRSYRKYLAWKKTSRKVTKPWGEQNVAGI
jgi:hypothetical protein